MSRHQDTDNQEVSQGSYISISSVPNDEPTLYLLGNQPKYIGYILHETIRWEAMPGRKKTSHEKYGRLRSGHRFHHVSC